MTGLEWALSMAASGYSVVPTRLVLKRTTSGELRKEPRGLPGGWQNTPVRAAESIRQAWAAIGATAYLIACGPSGITVVDLDTTHVDGMTAWSMLGGPRSVFVVRTPSGGEHHYFAGCGVANADLAYVDTSGGKVKFGDIRGVGGGVFGPGSVLLGEDDRTPAGTYTVVSG